MCIQYFSNSNNSIMHFVSTLFLLGYVVVTDTAFIFIFYISSVVTQIIASLF